MRERLYPPAVNGGIFKESGLTEKITKNGMAKKNKAADKKKRLTEGSIAKGLIFFALPFLISNVLQHLYTSVDALIVEMVVGSNAYNGVIQSGKIANVLVSFFTGISVGAGVVVAQYYGAKDKENLTKSVHTAIILSVILGLFLTFAGLLLSKPLLRAIGTKPESLSYATEYLNIYLLGAVFLVVYNMGAGILRAVGDTITPLIFLGVSAVGNVFLNMVFTPLFGVAGTAWVTVALQAVTAGLVLLKLFLTKQDYRLRVRDFKLDGKLCKKIFKLGLPTGLQNSVVSVAHLVMTGFINQFSVAEITGTYHYQVIDGFIYLPFNSFSTSLSTFVGQNTGAGNYARAKKSIKVCLCISMTLTIVMGAMVYIFGERLMALFEQKPINMVEAATLSFYHAGPERELMIKTSIKFMTLMVLSYPILVVTDTLAAGLRGAGQALVPAIITVTGMCFFRVLFMVVVMPFYKDILIVYLTYPISWFLCAIALIIYYIKGKWQSNAVTGKSPPPVPIEGEG